MSPSRSSRRSADDDVDAVVTTLWRKHLKETGRSCGRNANNWKLWLEGLDLNPDVDEKCEILVAEIEDECDGDERDCDNYTREVSVAGSPLFTDDDRRSGPAGQDNQSQGGPGKSKHQEYENIDDKFTPVVFDRACVNYARFSGIPREAVTAELIL